MVPKYLETLNKKKLPLFENFLTPLEILQQTMLLFKGIRFCSRLGSLEAAIKWCSGNR